MTDKSLRSNVPIPPAYIPAYQECVTAVTGSPGDYERQLKILLAAAFLPEGLSLFIGDFRLPIVRVLLIVLLIPATSRFLSRANSSRSILVPSDVIVMAAGIWMMMAGIVTDGFVEGAKGAGALALEFTGTYCVFRRLLEAPDSSVRLIGFSCWLIIVVVALALLDPLSGHLFVHDLVGRLTGHMKPYDLGSDGFVRNGFVRAMGPLEHSILFGAACTWIGILVLCTFGFSRSGIVVGIAALIGTLLSQSRASQFAYVLGVGLVAFHFVLGSFAARWKALMSLVGLYIVAVFVYSRNPVATLLQFGGLDPEAGWYRELIWQAAGPLVLASPMFGLGLSNDNWDWQSYDGLAGSSVDALWLRTAMLFGIPGSLLVFLTMISAFWLGALDRSPYLSRKEQRLSAALGITVSTIVFLGFTVHFWGTCWILLGAFSAIRANLAEAAILRGREAGQAPSP